MTKGPASSFYKSSGECVGFDVDGSRLERWQSLVWESDGRLLSDAADELRARLMRQGLCIPELDEAGLRFLCFRTSFARTWLNPVARDRHIAALIGWITVAASLSRRDVGVPLLSIMGTGTRALIGGTNLVVATKSVTSDDYLELRPSEQLAVVNGVTIPGKWLADRVLLEPGCDGGVHRVPYEEDFIFFYRAVTSNASFQDDRRLIGSDEPLSEERSLVSAVRDALREHAPAAWNLLRAQCVYLNWSTAAYMDSSSDLREARGSILLNPRRDQIRETNERTAWAAQGLYHEAKHWQFFDTYRSRLVPGVPGPPEVRLSREHTKIPCAWKALPSARTLEEHLLALQAFIPGLIAALRILSPIETFSQWLRDRIELEMRSANGAMSALIMGASHLTEEGHCLFKILLSDYESHLIPAYAAIQDRVEQ